MYRSRSDCGTGIQIMTKSAYTKTMNSKKKTGTSQIKQLCTIKHVLTAYLTKRRYTATNIQQELASTQIETMYNKACTGSAFYKA